MVNWISVTKASYILIVEVKRLLLGLVMKQCLLPMKDMGDINRGGVVYGFITTGMLSHDGAVFQVTEKVEVVFETMGKLETVQFWWIVCMRR